MNPYHGKEAVLLTKHGKEEVIAPIMADELGIKVKLVDNFDTDVFGTFTRDVPRQGNQLEAAIAKANKGMELTGLTLGIASEGAFTQDPFAGFLPWNYEVVVLVDKLNQRTFVGNCSNIAQAYSAIVKQGDDLKEHLKKCNFPSHGVVIRPKNHLHPEYKKGITTHTALDEAIAWAKSQGESSGSFFIENDLRAFLNPTRMQNIYTATLDLAEKIKSKCPACHAPGYSIVDKMKGLECSLCGNESNELKAHVLQCEVCKHREIRPVKKQFADPKHCNFCNP